MIYPKLKFKKKKRSFHVPQCLEKKRERKKKNAITLLYTSMVLSRGGGGGALESVTSKKFFSIKRESNSPSSNWHLIVVPWGQPNNSSSLLSKWSETSSRFKASHKSSWSWVASAAVVVVVTSLKSEQPYKWGKKRKPRWDLKGIN